MGRPKKNNADYFSHDANMRNHRKVKAIRAKFGITGYAIYSMMLEVLTDAEGNRIELNDIEIELLAGDFGVSVTDMREVLDYCVILRLFKAENDLIYSEGLDERLKSVYDKRKRASKVAENRTRNDNGKFSEEELSQLNGVSSTEIPQEKVSVPEKPQSKVKESKVKEIKREEVGEIIDFFNKTAVSFPQVKLTPNRVKKIRARIKENSKEEVFQMIKNAAGSSFLAGQNKNDWQANFDWLFRPNNFVKVLEGNYNNKQSEVKSQINGESWKRNVLK